MQMLTKEKLIGQSQSDNESFQVDKITRENKNIS